MAIDRLLYRLRWGIEQLFSHLKKRGFDLEATHMREARKLEKLFALVTLAFFQLWLGPPITRDP
jgi:hypothetical protein